MRVRPPPSAPKIIPRSTSGVLFLVRREGEPATCGSCMDARWRSRKVGARTRRPQRPQFDNPATLSPAQQAGYYFWCGGRENPQLAGRAWMQDGGRAKSAQGRADPNDRNSTTPLHFRPLNKRGIIFGAGGGRTRNLRVRHGCLIK